MTTSSPHPLLDKYRIIAQLGRGGMADVYLAASSGPGSFSKLLVVKVLQSSLSRDADFVEMFHDEARLAARLNHPNVVQTYEVGESEGRHFIAMEYLDGQPLSRAAAVLQQAGQLNLSVTLRIVMDGLAGLHYAHDLRGFDGRPLGVVHRDMTPHNLFVTYEGQIKLLDFGIAKAFDSSSHTKVGVVKGKVSYMAPEQARGETLYRTADIFSMGVILWELLAGRRLWEGLTDIAVVGRLVQGDIPHIREIRPDLPSRLSDVVMQALDPDPGKRPGTALSFQQRLETIFEALPSRTSNRILGETLSHAFVEEQRQVRAVVAKQLEKLARTTPSDATPAGGWKLAPGAGDMPILGEGSQVHEAVTRLHTDLTESAARAALTAADASSSSSTLVTDPNLQRANRKLVWIALVAAGVAGLSVGLTRPWNELPLISRARPETEDPGTKPNQSVPKRPSSLSGNLPPSTSQLGCDAPRKPLVELTGEIAEDAELGCDKDYLLRFSTYVSSGATLTIEAGTTIYGDLQTRGILVVQPGARIVAAGTATQPIVFTSAAPPADRKPGDWGGVVILGEAPTNLKDEKGNPAFGRAEGLTHGGHYGGNNENDSSGELSYVRIEYSGTEIAPNNEINGLTLGAVGRGTVLHHVQVRHTADDCFEFFGGTVDAKHLICQAPGDDAFDWDYGYTGRLQFLVAQMDARVSAGSNGLEGDNDPSGSKNQPISNPAFYNLTLCGKNRRLESKEHYGILLRRGSEVRIRNGLFLGFSAGLDIRDDGTRPNVAATTFFHNLVYNLAYPESVDSPKSNRLLFDDDHGFDEVAYLETPGLRIGQYDPGIGNCFASQAPSFKPRVPLVENAAIPPRDGFFDHDARFIGAFRDRKDDWDEGGWAKWSQ